MRVNRILFINSEVFLFFLGGLAAEEPGGQAERRPQMCGASVKKTAHGNVRIHPSAPEKHALETTRASGVKRLK